MALLLDHSGPTFLEERPKVDAQIYGTNFEGFPLNGALLGLVINNVPCIVAVFDTFSMECSPSKKLREISQCFC